MRCGMVIALVLCCVLPWQLASAHLTTTATAQRQHRRLRGTQPSAANVPHEHAEGLGRRLRELAARVAHRKPTRSPSSGARRRPTGHHKPHSSHGHPSPKPSAQSKTAPTEHEVQRKHPSSPPHGLSHSSPTPAEPSTAHRIVASDDAAPLSNMSMVITQRSCGVPDDSAAVKQQIQERLQPTIGTLMLEGRLATTYINVYFAINRIGGAPRPHMYSSFCLSRPVVDPAQCWKLTADFGHA